MENTSHNNDNRSGTIDEHIIELEERLMDLLQLRNYYWDLPKLPFDLQIEDTLSEIEYWERIK